MGEQKKRITEFDFVRAVCTIGIVFNHFTIDSKNSLQIVFFESPNGRCSVGYMLVTVFFLISGAMLYYHHAEIGDCKRYYISRWKSIFPAFYIAYAIVLVLRILRNPQYCVGKQASMFFFTILGLDGYLASALPTWYILGEWFLGAIILLYIMFPLLAWLLQKWPEGLYFSVFVLFCIFVNTRFQNQNEFRSVFSCLLTFCIGTALTRYHLYDSKPLTVVSAIVFIVLWFLPITGTSNINYHLSGIAFFFIVFAIGSAVIKSEVISKIITAISEVSYEMFLLHHVLLRAVLRYYSPSNTLFSCLEMIAVAGITYIAAYILHRVVKVIVRPRRTQVA